MLLQDPLADSSYLGKKEESAFVVYVVEGDVTNASVSYLDAQEKRYESNPDAPEILYAPRGRTVSAASKVEETS